MSAVLVNFGRAAQIFCSETIMRIDGLSNAHFHMSHTGCTLLAQNAAGMPRDERWMLCGPEDPGQGCTSGAFECAGEIIHDLHDGRAEFWPVGADAGRR